MDVKDLFNRDHEFVNDPMASVSLPIEYKRIPKRKELLCSYDVMGSIGPIPYEVCLVSPKKDRPFWSIWQSAQDPAFYQDMPATPVGWVSAKPKDDPNEIAKFLFIGSFAADVSEKPCIPSKTMPSDMHNFTPGILSLHDIIACIFSIYKEFDITTKEIDPKIKKNEVKKIIDASFASYKPLVKIKLKEYFEKQN